MNAVNQNAGRSDRAQIDGYATVEKKMSEENTVEALAENAKKVTDKLCRELSAIENKLVKVLEKYQLSDAQTLKKFDFQGFAFRKCGSRLGKWIHIVYVDEFDDNSSRLRILPDSSEEVGSGFYYHQDYSAWYNYMTRSQVLDFAHALRAFLENFNGTLVKIAEEAKIEIPRVPVV